MRQSIIKQSRTYLFRFVRFFVYWGRQQLRPGRTRFNASGAALRVSASSKYPALSPFSFVGSNFSGLRASGCVSAIPDRCDRTCLNRIIRHRSRLFAVLLPVHDTQFSSCNLPVKRTVCKFHGAATFADRDATIVQCYRHTILGTVNGNHLCTLETERTAVPHGVNECSAHLFSSFPFLRCKDD